jgi:N-acetylglucosamine-6-phosphate deacetylase
MGNQQYYHGPGMVDLQINGYRGIDFNSPGLDVDALVFAAESLREKGVIKFLPTLITNEIGFLETQLSTIQKACHENKLLAEAIAGIHLEGPFISSEPGAIGAHPVEHTKIPDLDLFESLWQASKGSIKIMTLAPELKGAFDLIQKCRERNVITAIGHSLATSSDITKAVDHGLCFSTHLGNALPLSLERYDNALYAQMNAQGLGCSVVYDGHHLSKNLMQLILKTKEAPVFLVSDATAFAGLEPGIYDSPIGGKVELNTHGRLSMQKNNMLAGSSASLLDCVIQTIQDDIIKPDTAWKMASSIPAKLIGLNIEKINKIELEYHLED